MDDLISRTAAIEVLKDEWVGVPVYYLCGEDIFEYSKLRIESLPSTQPERKRGEWIFDGDCLICSECNKAYTFIGSNFCPNCGADMRGEQDE